MGTTGCCWTSRPGWSRRSPPTGACWRQRSPDPLEEEPPQSPPQLFAHQSETSETTSWKDKLYWDTKTETHPPQDERCYMGRQNPAGKISCTGTQRQKRTLLKMNAVTWVDKIQLEKCPKKTKQNPNKEWCCVAK